MQRLHRPIPRQGSTSVQRSFRNRRSSHSDGHLVRRSLTYTIYTIWLHVAISLPCRLCPAERDLRKLSMDKVYPVWEMHQ
jgi:hypothetical protein